MHPSLPAALAVATCTALLVVPAAAQGSRAPAGPVHAVYRAVLRGSDEVPPVPSRANGTAQLTVVGSLLLYRVNVDDLRDVTGVFLHVGRPGQSRPVVAALYEGVHPGVLSGALASGTLRSRDVHGTTMTQLVRALSNNDVYLSVHTKEHPRGELRGELLQQPSAIGG